jgi:hypothetical protein
VATPSLHPCGASKWVTQGATITVTMQTGYKMAIKSCFYSHVIALL